jgi:protein-tyrosine phosphatase
MIEVLFVCTGNICRSPTAEGVFRALVAREGLTAEISVDSAGTHGWHQGEPPDRRSITAAARRGIDIADQRSRPVTAADFKTFDYMIAMDGDNFDILSARRPADARARLDYFLDFAPEVQRREVPDPYYGGDGGFDDVLDMIEVASAGLLEDIREKHLRPTA